MKKIVTNKYILAALALLVLSVAALYWFNKSKDNNNAQNSATSDTQMPEENESAGNTQNQSSEDNSGNSESPTDSELKPVTPVIASWGQGSGTVEVSARVPEIIESSGTCTLTLKKDSKVVTQEKKATPNVSEMSCGFISVPRSKLSSGAWSAEVSYKSSKAEGNSEPKNIEVE